MIKCRTKSILLTAIFSTQLSFNVFAMMNSDENPSYQGIPTRQPRQIVVDTNSPEFKALVFYDKYIRGREGVSPEEELDEHDRHVRQQDELPGDKLDRLRREWNRIRLGRYGPPINTDF